MNEWNKNLSECVEKLRKNKRSQKTVNTWFYVQEIKMQEHEAMRREGINPDDVAGQAELLCRVAEKMPLPLPAGSVLAGSQDVAFSPSYALINPSFKVEEFAGYCDPCAAYDDVTLNEDLSSERVENVRRYWEASSYVKDLYSIYDKFSQYTGEVAFFMEPVTGHTIPDLRPIIKNGVKATKEQALASKTVYGTAMARSLDAVLIIAERYRELALEKAEQSNDPSEQECFGKMASVLSQVPENGASNLHEALQIFTLLWQVMVLEQAPNPYAFSVGNLDRILSPYLGECDFEEAVELVRHLLCFFQVGNRCWAISQNIMVGGRDEHGKDLSYAMTDIVLEAFFRSNDPQPALSVKVHSGTPEKLYLNIGRFFFTPGHSTPSLFNDDSIFQMLEKQGIVSSDLPDYSIAGCQEPLIMGKSSLNTTNTWLNIAKILELVLNDGKSLISGKQIGPTWKELGYANINAIYADAENAFLKLLDIVLPQMEAAGNGCTSLLGQEKPVPFCSALMDSFSSFRDMRDPKNPGTRYNGSGCLIHGLSVVSDSLSALKSALTQWSADEILAALKSDFSENERMQAFMSNLPKYGNNSGECDNLATEIATKVSERISSLCNPAGNAFLADWSTPSTHLLYGYWVGATPDGRKARTMLGYGIDPRAEASKSELPERFLSFHKLPFDRMTGGYASHIGICPVDAELGKLSDDKSLWMRDRIIKSLFRLDKDSQNGNAPYYVYFNIDSADHLRAVLKSPDELAPSGVYIMRIHGTFVNFLDLSPAIQEDIIKRLEAGGSAA